MSTATFYRDWAGRKVIILTGAADMPPGMIEVEVVEGPDKGSTHWIEPDWITPWDEKRS